jgi:nucleoside-diphosphate-sugar epimerase
MKVLIIGGTGFIGSAVASQLNAQDDEVVLFNRGRTTANGPVYRTLHGDVYKLSDYADQLRSLRPDAVIHTIAYSQQDAERLLDVFRGVNCKLVVLGSQDCYRGFHAFQKGTELSDFPIDESMPLAERYYWKRHGHPSHASAEQYDKNLMTEVLMTAATRREVTVTVLRLPMVWGPADPQPQYRHADIVWHLLDERDSIVLGEREQAQIWTYGYIDNVAAAIVHSLRHERATNGIFNVGETKVRTKRRWVDLYSRAAGRPLEVHVVPDWLLEDGNDRNAPAFHLIMDNTAFISATGFADPVPIDAALERTLKWSRDNVDALGSRPPYETRLERVRTYTAAIDRVITAPR